MSSVKLSVIIVSYNVASFLEQCLLSLKRAGEGIAMEVFVVDNHSIDSSVDMLREKFPDFILIENKDNLGFSKANNQALRLAKGEYVLLLNPDTLLESDTLSECIAFMDGRPEAGALGVKMVDGNGRYLPESKRGFPKPKVALYKILGLHKIFPRSKNFAYYYEGHLSENDVNNVDVLAGAFMWIRKTTLDQAGLLDEDFFMYGEDIDLSYRLSCVPLPEDIKTKTATGNYMNYYFPKTRIIHYKGESTKKGSLNYVLIFYKAMQIFAKKHFAKNQLGFYNILINTAIWGRASLSILSRLFSAIILPLLDFFFIFLCLFCLQKYWSIFYFKNPLHFSDFYKYFVLPGYALLWTGSMLLSKVYQYPFRPIRLLQGLFIGSLCLFTIHFLLGSEWQFSRFMVLLGFFASFILLFAWRCLLQHLSPRFSFYSRKKIRYLLFGEKKETDILFEKLLKKGIDSKHIYLCSVQKKEDISEMIRLYKPDKLIFCASDLSFDTIIELMSTHSNKKLDYKIAFSDRNFMLGSKDVEFF